MSSAAPMSSDVEFPVSALPVVSDSIEPAPPPSGTTSRSSAGANSRRRCMARRVATSFAACGSSPAPPRERG